MFFIAFFRDPCSHTCKLLLFFFLKSWRVCLFFVIKWKLRFTWYHVTPGNGAFQWTHCNTNCKIMRPGRWVWGAELGDKGKVDRSGLYLIFRHHPFLYHHGNFPIAAIGITFLLLFKGYHHLDFGIKHFPGMSNGNLASNRRQGCLLL